MRLWKIFCKIDIVVVKKSKCDFRKKLDPLCCTGAAHDHHLTHEKIDLSNQANMHTTTRSQLCGNCFRVSHWKIWPIFSEYYKQSSRSVDENNDSISNHNLIRIYQSLETSRESYFEEKKILCWQELLKIVDFEKLNTDYNNEIQYDETLFLNLLWWAPTCRPRWLSSERKHYLDLAHSKSQTRFAWWRSTVKNNRLHNFVKMFLKRNSYFNALAFSEDLWKITKIVK